MILSVDACFLVVFVVLAYAFAFHSKLLVAFLGDICLLYAFRILRELTRSAVFTTPIALTTVVLAALALWLAFAVLVNSAAGRPVFKIPGPLLAPASPTPATSA